MKENIFPIKELETQRDKLLKESTFNIEKEVPCIKTGADTKTAKKWAEKYLKSKEYQLEKVKMYREFTEFFLYGNATNYFNDELMKEIYEYAITVEELSVEQIIERFGALITDKDIENIKNIQNGTNTTRNRKM